jgi:hypothetical protein
MADTRRTAVSSVTPGIYTEYGPSQLQQYRKCTCNVTMWRIRVTIVSVETQQCILCVLLSYMSLPTMQQYLVLHNDVFMKNLLHQQQ